MSNKLMLLEQMEEWANEQKRTVSKSTATNRKSTFAKLELYMQQLGIPDFDLLDYNFTVQRPTDELMEKGEWLENFFLGFRDWLIKDMAVQESTANQHRTNLVVFLNWSRFKRIRMQVPVPDFFKKRMAAKDRVAALSPKQSEMILRLPTTSSHNINAKLALISCWRVSDLISLRVRDVELDKSGSFYWITKVQQKTKRLVRTPIPFALMSRIFRYFKHDQNSEDKYLLKFDTPCYEGVPRARRFVHDIRKALAEAFGAEATIKVIGFDGETFHINISQYHRPVHLLRRSGATYYSANGMPIETITALFTGNDPDTLKNYYIEPATQRAYLEGDFAFNQDMKANYGYNELMTGRTGNKDEKIMEQMSKILAEEA